MLRQLTFSSDRFLLCVSKSISFSHRMDQSTYKTKIAKDKKTQVVSMKDPSTISQQKSLRHGRILLLAFKTQQTNHLHTQKKKRIFSPTCTLKARNNHSKEEYFRYFEPWCKYPEVRYYKVSYVPIKSPFTANYI